MDRTALRMSTLSQANARVTTEVEENVTRYWIKGMKLILNLLIVTILATLLVGVLKAFVDLWSVFHVPVEQVLRQAIPKVIRCSQAAPGYKGGRMDASRNSDRLVLDVLRSSSAPLTFEEIIARIPELSWNQVFLTVDALSRSGEIILSRAGFEYQAIAAGDLTPG